MTTENKTVSVSRGVFVFKNNFISKRVSKTSVTKDVMSNVFSNNLWYQEYIALWTSIAEDIENLTYSIFTEMTKDLLQHIEQAYVNEITEIPTAVLLTGINMPDHEGQFRNLEKQVKKRITPHVAILNSQDCNTLKYLMENMINQFLNSNNITANNMDDLEDQLKSNIKKSQYNLSLLENWYEDLYITDGISKNGKLLLIIIPDFESFNIKVLQKFILIASSYIPKLPFVFVFGIATSVSTIHTVFPYHVSSKISIKVFKCEPSIHLLNKMLEKIFLNLFCPFQFGGNVFNLFTDIFLFYDYSVHNFIQNIKYTMMEHFCYGNAMALCNLDQKEVKETLKLFKNEDFENVRHLRSFRKLVESESYQNQINLLTNDDYLKSVIYENVITLQRYIRRLHIFLKCLYTLVHELPGYPLGKQLRELYAMAVSGNITKTDQYKECFQLLDFQSKEELSMKLESIMKIFSEIINENSKRTQLKEFYYEIKKYKIMLDNLNDAAMDDVEDDSAPSLDHLSDKMGACPLDRNALKEALLSRLKQKRKHLNKYEKMRKEILDVISRTFELYLVEPSSHYFYEIFFFDDISVQNKIVGIHRSAIHMALNNPQYYFQCTCCEINDSHTIKPTMPDVCIIYKLHLECGKMINMYDWLQAFLCIVDPNVNQDDDINTKKVDPRFQARFTRAVAELEYLGFIKGSKRKADHVSRLTWGS